MKAATYSKIHVIFILSSHAIVCNLVNAIIQYITSIMMDKILKYLIHHNRSPKISNFATSSVKNAANWSRKPGACYSLFWFYACLIETEGRK